MQPLLPVWSCTKQAPAMQSKPCRICRGPRGEHAGQLRAAVEQSGVECGQHAVLLVGGWQSQLMKPGGLACLQKCIAHPTRVHVCYAHLQRRCAACSIILISMNAVSPSFLECACMQPSCSCLQGVGYMVIYSRCCRAAGLWSASTCLA